MTNLIKKHLTALLSSAIALINGIILAYSTYADMGIAPSKSGISLSLFIILSLVSLFIFVREAVSLFSESRRIIKINNKNKISTIKYKDKISKYLIDFIATGGDIVIVSRNLSWITRDVIWRMEDKAKSGELTIFIPFPDSLGVSEKLKKFGADVRYYGGLVDDATWFLETRFTIAQWRSSSKRMTFPKTLSEYHYNYELVPSEPTMDIALDLVRLLDKATATQAKRKRGSIMSCEIIELITTGLVSEIQSIPYSREIYAEIIQKAKNSFASYLEEVNFCKLDTISEILASMHYTIEEIGESYIIAKCHGQTHLFYCAERPQKEFKEFPSLVDEQINEQSITRIFYQYLLSVIARSSDTVMFNPLEHQFISNCLSIRV